MKTILATLLAASLCAAAQTAGQPDTPADQYRAIEQDYRSAMAAFQKLVEAAQTDGERGKIYQEHYPKPDAFAARMRALAEKHPKDPAAVDALVWVLLRNRRGSGEDQIITLLLENHAESEKLGSVAEMLGYSRNPSAKKTLEEIRAKSPHRKVKGLATFALGYLAYGQSQDRSLTPEAESIFQQVLDEYPDVNGSRGLVADSARGILFSAKNLAAGKTAPEIAGEDVDGVAFKLSDYRGKVVLIDFWGDW